MKIKAPVSPARRKILLAGAALTISGCGRNLLDSDANTAEMSNSATAIERLSFVGKGWARSSVNSTIFRKDALTSNTNYQYVAYYDDDAQVIVGQRMLESDNWTTAATGFYGRPEDAHNCISLMLDGDDYLHIAWDHHVNPLNYSRSTAANSLEFSSSELMINLEEDQVTYPEFHALASGDLLFAYRQGRSGNGKLVLNRYECATQSWTRIHSNLLDGEGQRNAYWQIHVDKSDVIHLSWVWRETSDASTNHDLHYARSLDGGSNWVDELNVPLSIPVTADNTAPVWPIPQGQNLINQTSLTADSDGSPYIATYFRNEEQFTNIQLVFFDASIGQWKSESVSARTSDFELGGGGSKSLPISRPLILFEERGGARWLHVFYRDTEYGDQALHASSERNTTPASPTWTRRVLPGGSVDRWEPVFDSRLWHQKGLLHIYLQRVGQIDGDLVTPDYPPTEIHVLEVSLLTQDSE